MSVYFAKQKGLIKIGFSRSVPARLRALKADLLGAIEGGRDIESATHQKFAHLCVRGELYTPAEELLEYIRVEAQSHTPDDETAEITLRLPRTLLKKLDRLAKRMSQPGIRISRARALRAAAFLGVAQLEAENRKVKKR